ncbi:helix-turn-helix domain-containing protein [Salinibacillus xinjiangensis]|uniref:Helix-turn-helix domain-containing protein n=2 Tax=Salinibacillus xinjiangensis TaxID=1229268 RepID=A0A6G1XBZ5_9BACI|nr:helix-turn-helix domain-containing protein [Salinibacillus xinjiangensis]MRG88400.1 helix-turn-helix domain-containing protein [Salinibacillus xinjiangensis]
MAKYSEEFKMKLVTEYLDGNIGYGSLAKKYNMGSQTPIREWVSAYKFQGIDGLKRRKTKKEYSVQFKLGAIQFMLTTGASYLETAVHFKLNNPSLIKRWTKEFHEQGVEGLNAKPKGRPSMSKKPNKQKKKEEKKITREEELERENELLRLENAYLKKLRAFRENPNAFYEKHKQGWHLNSKKKDSD